MRPDLDDMDMSEGVGLVKLQEEEPLNRRTGRSIRAEQVIETGVGILINTIAQAGR